MGYSRFYYLKKAYALYPGVVTPVSAPFLRDHYARRRAARGVPRALLDAAVGLGFHLWIPWRARSVQRRFGLDAEWRRRAAAIAHARFADPNDLALFRIERADELDGYMRRFEDAAINKLLNPLGWTDHCALADKRRFAERCAATGLPHPETLAVLDGGTVSLLAGLAGRAVVAKPTDGEGGDGVRLLGPVCDGDELKRRIAQEHGWGRSPVLFQPQVETHPALAGIALGALPTVRIVTILDEAGQPEPVSATFRCASDPAARVDNMKAGGLIAAVDLSEGRLGVACKGYAGGDYPVHPVTGEAIAGRVLPDWPEAKALAARAHAAAFQDYAIVGWDVALTPDGPLLIEANGKPGVLMPQRAARRGLGGTRYGALISHQLANASQ